MLREGSPPPACHVSCVTCHMICAICYVSRVQCHNFFLYCFFLNDKVVKLVGGGSDINRANLSRF